MALSILGAYRPAAASTARTSVALSSQAIVTASVYARFIATSVAGSLFGPAGGRNWAIGKVGGQTGVDYCGSWRSFTGAGILLGEYNRVTDSTDSTGDVNPSAVAGDLIETLWHTDIAAKTTDFAVYKNGGSALNATQLVNTGASAAQWGGGSAVLFINQIDGAAFGDQSILAVCYASGSPTIAEFRTWFTLTGRLFRPASLDGGAAGPLNLNPVL